MRKWGMVFLPCFARQGFRLRHMAGMHWPTNDPFNSNRWSKFGIGWVSNLGHDHCSHFGCLIPIWLSRSPIWSVFCSKVHLFLVIVMRSSLFYLNPPILVDDQSYHLGQVWYITWFSPPLISRWFNHPERWTATLLRDFSRFAIISGCWWFIRPERALVFCWLV